MSRVSEIVHQRNQDATLWVGGLDERVDEDLLWELFLQMGPLVDVSVPLDKVNGRPSGFAFVEYRSELDAEYALKVLNMLPLYGRGIRVRKAGDGGANGGPQGVPTGANLFVGNLPGDATEKSLYDTFSAFGTVVETKVQRDLETGAGKGFGFVNFDDFEASDAAIDALNGQFMLGRPIVVQYALRKDSRTERHGSVEERTLAASAKAAKAAGGGGGGGGHPAVKPHKHFGVGSGVVSSSVALGVEMGMSGGGMMGAPMMGLPHAMPIPMQPPTAIAVHAVGGGLLAPSLIPPPPPPPFSAVPGVGGFTLVPPPLPSHFLLPSGAIDNRPAWMQGQQ
jgi:splicing factor 3B subunit 4